jgi:hypothetical protein
MQAIGILPGKSITFTLAVPVEDVLGDSLPNGRYHVTVSIRVSGKHVRGLNANDVELSSPRIAALVKKTVR